jgi:hypothetical protein
MSDSRTFLPKSLIAWHGIHAGHVLLNTIRNGPCAFVCVQWRAYWGAGPVLFGGVAVQGACFSGGGTRRWQHEHEQVVTRNSGLRFYLLFGDERILFAALIWGWAGRSPAHAPRSGAGGGAGGGTPPVQLHSANEESSPVHELLQACP